MTGNNKIDINDLNILRVFALSMVVLRHSFAPYIGSWGLEDVFESSYNAKIIGKYVSTISMPLYVFISGILFSYLRNSLLKYPTYKVLLQKKIKRLIRPYVILAPLYIFFFTEAETFWEFWIVFFEGAGHLWFLLMIFTVFLIFYPFEQYFKNNVKKGFVVISGVYCIHPILYHFCPTAFVLMFKYMPFFYVGYMFFYKSNKILSFLKNKLLLLVLIHAVLFILVYIVLPFYASGTRLNIVISRLMFLPIGMLSISFVYLIFSKIEYLNSKKSNQLIKNINTNSYYIYILHQPFLMLLFQQDFLISWNEVSVILGSFILVFLTSILFSNQIMKFKIGKKLIGA